MQIYIFNIFFRCVCFGLFRNLGFSLDCSATRYNPLKKKKEFRIYITPLKVSHGPAGVLSLR